MSGLPNEGQYVTAGVPPEMRVDGVELIPPTAIVDDVDGVPTQLTRVRLERPAHIPMMPAPQFSGPSPTHMAPGLVVPTDTLQYDFPLLPGVQCRVIFQGELTADHLEQLSDYLGVACKRLREQQSRGTLKVKESVKSSAKQFKTLKAALDKAGPFDPEETLSALKKRNRPKKKEKTDGQVP